MTSRAESGSGRARRNTSVLREKGHFAVACVAFFSTRAHCVPATSARPASGHMRARPMWQSPPLSRVVSFLAVMFPASPRTRILNGVSRCSTPHFSSDGLSIASPLRSVADTSGVSMTRMHLVSKLSTTRDSDSVPALSAVSML